MCIEDEIISFAELYVDGLLQQGVGLLHDAIHIHSHSESSGVIKVLWEIVGMEGEVAGHGLHLEVEFELSGGRVRADADVDIHGDSVGRSDGHNFLGGSRAVVVETPPFRALGELVDVKLVLQAVRLHRAVSSLPLHAVAGVVASALAVGTTVSKTEAVTHVSAHGGGDGASIPFSALAGELFVRQVIGEEGVGGLVIV